MAASIPNVMTDAASQPEAVEALVALRQAICATCDENRGLGVATVRCRAAGCSVVSLVRCECRLRKWPRLKGARHGADG